jgi:hypothetical protein
MKSPNFVTKNDLLLTSIFLCVKVIGMVQDNLPTYVFSIDIPVSLTSFYLQVTVVSMTPLCRVQLSQISYKKQCVELFAKKLVALQCQCHRCYMQISVIDTDVQPTLSIIRKGFNLCIRDPGEVV